jgi:PhoH-like ATPase
MAMDIKESHNFSQTILVTKDINLRVRADALGIEVEDYDAERQEISELYTGFAEIEMSGNDIDLFYSQGYLSLTDPYWFPNQFIHIKDYANPSHSALGKVSVEQERILPILRSKEGVWGVRPRNKEQAFALDLLMDDSIKLVTLVGKAGTGKTLVAMAAGLHKVTEESKYQRVSVARPIMPMGKDIGYLPGSVEEKVSPYMQGIYDNVEFLMGLSSEQKRGGRSYQELIDLGIIHVEPLTFIRGRSIPYQFLVIDEVQNTSLHEIRTIITRCGEGTKIILTGDPYQIDSPYLDSMSNGLTHVVNAFKAERIAGHITLTKGERSELAELAANLL